MQEYVYMDKLYLYKLKDKDFDDLLQSGIKFIVVTDIINIIDGIVKQLDTCYSITELKYSRLHISVIHGMRLQKCYDEEDI